MEINEFEIMLTDLREDIFEQACEFLGLKPDRNGNYTDLENYEILPIASIPKPKVDLCESCKKCGETTCGNDTLYHRCFEPR